MIRLGYTRRPKTPDLRRFQVSRNVNCALLALIVVAVLAGCASKTPVEQMIEARAAYKVSLNPFFTKQVPVGGAEAAPVGEEASDADASEVGSDEGVAAAEDVGTAEEPPVEVPMQTNVHLDIIVQHRLDEALEGLTLDISMIDDKQNEVGQWKVWVETAGLLKANQLPVTHVLEDVDFEEGYGFNVEVRSGIPPSEYGDYREFDGLQ